MKRCVVSSLLAIVIALCMPLVLAAKMSDEAFSKLCAEGSPEQVQEAIKAGVDVNSWGMWGWKPLDYAAFHNNNPEVITLLLKAGAEVNARDEEGSTPLHKAAEVNPNLKVIMLLLKAGANPKMSDDYGWTPLHNAVMTNRNPEVVKALLKAGSDVHAIDSENKRPVDYADSNEHLKGTEAYRHLYELSNGVGREKKMARPKYKIVAEEKNYEQYIVKFYNENIQVMHKLENTLERGSWTMTWDPGLGPLPFAVIFSGFFKNTEGVMRKIMLIFSVYPDKDNTDIRRIRHAFDGDAFFREGLPAWLEYEIMN